jgi:hypothetical protein
MGNIRRGTFQRKGKPTRFTVELYLKYFELGGRPDDIKINPLVSEQIQKIMGWEDGEGIVCLLWGLNPKTANAKKHNYRDPMVVGRIMMNKSPKRK